MQRVLVLGSGVIGVSSAWYLANAGFEVTVVDREPGPALAASYANAGQISPGYASPWAAVESIAPKIGCSPHTLHEWVKRHEVDTGLRDGVTSEEHERIKALEREVKELRRANEILKLASAFFAQAELDRRLKS